MTMAYVRKTYGVPCKRGNQIRAWYGSRESGIRLASNFTKITSATHYVYTASSHYHPTHLVEYADAEGYRIWPVTPEEIEKAGFPSYFCLFAPTRPKE